MRPSCRIPLAATLLFSASFFFSACSGDPEPGDPLDLADAEHSFVSASHGDMAISFQTAGLERSLSPADVDLVACTLDEAGEREFWMYEDAAPFFGRVTGEPMYHLYVSERLAVAHLPDRPGAFMLMEGDEEAIRYGEEGGRVDLDLSLVGEGSDTLRVRGWISCPE